MRYRFCLIFALGAIPAFSQTVSTCHKVIEFKALLEKNHVNRQPWNDAFFERMVNQLFVLIDPHAMYFTQNEKNIFLSSSKKYGSLLQSGDCSVITDITPVYKNALARVEGIIHSIHESPLNFNDKDTFRIKFANITYPTEQQLKKQWLRLIKLGVLMDTKGESDKNYKTALDRNCKKYLNVLKRRREAPEGMEEYLLDKLLNAIATSYDPHTAFFSKNEKQSFMDALSTDHFSFGIILDDDAFGNIIIDRIIPGSSAWDAGTLHVGDIITTVKNTSPENIDASLYTAEELEDILTSLHEPIELSVKKVNGEQTTTRLIKQKIREDENNVKSLVLSNQKNRFGYVNLPVFFSSGELSHSGCADDLAKEIIQLKKAKIQGLILDLRNNGGGDLEEAVMLAGIFIDRGAIGIMKYYNNETETLKDANPGTAYEGPLLIMVNGGSASASELFVAAMRAHNRAIIAGSTTYGKGTGQSVIPFGNNEMVKITSFRFYDPVGKSHQGKGLRPDIEFPDLFSLYDYNESHQPYALTADSVVKKTYYTPLPMLPLKVLRDSSLQRIQKNDFFKEIESGKTKKNPFINRQGILLPLTVSDIQHIESEKIIPDEDQHPVADHYTIKLTQFDEQVQGVDAFGTETFKILTEEVSKDHYIDEALNILAHYLKIQKK